MEVPPNLNEMAIRADERQKTEEFICKRLEDWVNSGQDAQTAFTAGPLRQLASRLENDLRLLIHLLDKEDFGNLIHLVVGERLRLMRMAAKADKKDVEARNELVSFLTYSNPATFRRHMDKLNACYEALVELYDKKEWDV